MKRTRHFLLSLLIVLTIVSLVSCGGDASSSPSVVEKAKAFSVGDSLFDTLQQAVSFIVGDKSSKVVSYTIRLNYDVTDAGADIPDLSGSLILDFGNYTYTLSNGSKGIVINNPSGTTIKNGSITVASGASLADGTKAVITTQTGLSVSDIKLKLEGSSENGIEASAGTVKLSGATEITTKGDKKTIVATENAQVTVAAQSSVVLTGSLKMQDNANVNLGNAIVNLTSEIEKGEDVSFFIDNVENIKPSEDLKEDVKQSITESITNAAHNHQWVKDVEKSQAPTCTEAGYDYMVCSENAEHTKQEPVPAKGHSFSEAWTNDATYHWHAATCGHDVSDSKAEHEWGIWEITTEATHTTAGEKTRTCFVCKRAEVEAIPANTDAHTFAEAWSTDATHHWHAATCGHDVTDSKAEHEWGVWEITTEATHTTAGEKTRTCFVCKRAEVEAIPANTDAHTFSEEWTFDATHHWHAATCGHDVTDSKAEHEWGVWEITTEATHTTAGEKTHTCFVCKRAEVEAIPANTDAHTFSEEWTFDATHHWHAATCGHEDAVEMINHSLNSKSQCLVCGYDASYKYEGNWKVSSNGVLSPISKQAVMGSVLIPGKVGNRVVTGLSGFDGCVNMTDILIPASVTDIYIHTFKDCTGLTEIEIPSTVTYIGPATFLGCTCSVSFAEGTTSIPDMALSGASSVTSVSIPSSVTSIGITAFQGCTGLSVIVIPESVTSIGQKAFWGCSGLTEIVIPKNVKNIGNEAFWGCTCSVSFAKGMTSIPDNALSGASGIKTITIPSSVTSIGDGSFYDCSGLTEITIPPSVTTIGTSAFSGCIGLTKVDIPSSVTSIGNNAFYDCIRLTEIIIPSSVTTIGASAFNGCMGLTRIEIPSSVSSIGQYAFWRCEGAVLFSEGWTTIPAVFSDVHGITSVTIPSSATSISASAFSGCYSLTEITFKGNNSLENIGKNAFSGCNKLKEIEIPSSVTTIGSGAFYDCNGLTKIYIPSSVINIGDGAFTGCAGAVVFAEGWTTIPAIFKRVPFITSVTFPSSIKSIEKEAFYECYSLGSITYEGTRSQWNEVQLVDHGWHIGILTTVVHCADGDVNLW